MTNRSPSPANKSQVDELDDSLASISEHISEEIESEDGSNAAAGIDVVAINNKKRQLFNFDNDEGTEGNPPKFSQFDINNDNLDELLSGANIAQHFKSDVNDDSADGIGERHERSVGDTNQSKNSLSPKLDENDGDDAVGDAGNGTSSLELENAAQRLIQSAERSPRDGELRDDDDVILINDHEISIKSLQNRQNQLEHISEQNETVVTNQNTTSDISDIVHENDDVSGSMKDAELQKSSSDAEPLKEDEPSGADGVVGSEPLSPKGDLDSERSDRSESEQSLEVGVSPEQSVESDEVEMKNIIIETVGRIPVLLSRLDEVDESEKTEVQSNGFISSPRDSSMERTLRSRKNSDIVIAAVVESTVEQIIQDLPLTDLPMDLRPEGIEDEISVNLLHMQNKIKELQDLTSGKYQCMTTASSVMNYPMFEGSSSSRRDSLKDLPLSGRDSTSIATNSTEYRTFPEEYFNMMKVSH